MHSFLFILMIIFTQTIRYTPRLDSVERALRPRGNKRCRKPGPPTRDKTRRHRGS